MAEHKREKLHHAMEEVSTKSKEAKGKTKEKVGWATGDRELEASGQVDEEQAAVERGEREPDTVESVQKAKVRVRRSYDELDG